MLGGSSSECFIAETMELDYGSQILVPTSTGDSNVIQFHPIRMTFSECLLCACLRAVCWGSSGERLRTVPAVMELTRTVYHFVGSFKRTIP